MRQVVPLDQSQYLLVGGTQPGQCPLNVERLDHLWGMVGLVRDPFDPIQQPVPSSRGPAGIGQNQSGRGQEPAQLGIGGDIGEATPGDQKGLGEDLVGQVRANATHRKPEHGTAVLLEQPAEAVGISHTWECPGRPETGHPEQDFLSRTSNRVPSKIGYRLSLTLCSPSMGQS